MGATREAEATVIQTLSVLTTPGSTAYNYFNTTKNEEWKDVHFDNTGLIAPELFSTALQQRLNEAQAQEQTNELLWKCISFFDATYAYFICNSKVTQSERFRNTNKKKAQEMMNITEKMIFLLRGPNPLNRE